MKRRRRISPARFLLCQLLIASVAGVAQARNPAPWVGETLYGEPCQGTPPTEGPYDYLNQPQNSKKLAVVERFHFTPGVQNLTKGASTTPMGDIDYVLRHFPNHHGALNSAATFSLQHERHPAKEWGLPAECYLMRAMNFNQWDPVLPKIYGYYLHRKGRLEEALAMNQEALSRMPGDAMLQYNTALLLVDLERYDEAMQLARPLYDAGLTMPGLRSKLIRAGHWEFVGDERERFAEQVKAAEMAAANKPPTAVETATAPTTPPEISVTTDEGIDAAESEE